jgi:uncharacterized phiE125 gp8 family phage protein
MNITRTYRTVVTTPPTVEPVTLAEAKLHLRVDNDDENDYINSLIAAAREWATNEARRAFIHTTYRLSLDAFPNEIRLPWGTISSISTFTYVDEDGATQTLSSSSDYTLDSDSEPARLVPYYEASWPSIRSVPNAIKVTYVAGYGAAATSVPDSVKNAIKLALGHWYEHREMVTDDGTLSEVPMAAQALLDIVRIREFF